MKKFILDGTKGIFSNYLKGWFEEYYLEPTRKGIPKGKPIGFSKTKFRATLWSLTSIEIKKQAEILNVSYGVLRKWRTEEQFAWEVNMQTQTFIRFLLEHLEHRAREKWITLDGRYSEEESVFYKTIIDPELKKDFGDIEFYNPDLLLAIYNRFTNLDSKEPYDTFEIFRFYFVLYIIESIIKKASIHAEQDILHIKKVLFNKLKWILISSLDEMHFSQDRLGLAKKLLALLPGYIGL